MCTTFQKVVWEWGDREGLEHLRLHTFADAMKAEGLVIADDEDGIVRFRYSMRLRADGGLKWCGVFVLRRSGIFMSRRTIQESLSLSLERDGWFVETLGSRRSARNRRPDLADCVTLDIIDTPFPKTMALKSLDLAEGASTTITVALVDNRRLSVDPVEQTWERLTPDRTNLRRYRCTTNGKTFEFRVDEDFLVRSCQTRWRVTSSSLSSL